MSYRLLLVDDESLARERLKRMLQNSAFKVVAEAENGMAALAWLANNNADVVLLDIQMPGLTGLEVAEKLQQFSHPPRVIFCTAYDEHALAAFKVQALDYLLKPVRQEDLNQALSRAEEWLQNSTSKDSDESAAYIVASGHRGVERIALEQVLACVAEQKYVQVFHQQGTALIDDSLRQLEDNFPNYFIRCHRSALVAKDKMLRLQALPAGGHQLWLEGLTQPMPVSRRHLSLIKTALVKTE